MEIKIVNVKVIDNINTRLGDDLKTEIRAKSHLKIVASTFSIYAFEALHKELNKIASMRFLFNNPTFNTVDVDHAKMREKREFFIPKSKREQDIYGNEFEIQLRNKLTQKAIAKECAQWVRQKVTFYSPKAENTISQNLIHVSSPNREPSVYVGTSDFNPSGLAYEQSNQMLNAPTKITGNASQALLEHFNSVWANTDMLDDVTDTVIEYISILYKENSPAYIYYIILYNIFSDFLEDLTQDVLPNEQSGYKDTIIWNKLFDFQKDGVQGIISKMEKYNGCILADSVGLGKTFSALAVMKYYQDRNKSILVLCPKKLSNNWNIYKGNLKTNILYQDRFNYDVLHHSDLTRTDGISNGMPLNQIHWGNYDVVVIDESHNFRNDEAIRDRKTRYQKLMKDIMQSGVQTKVLMLSATPVNNRFKDLKNQLQLAYEGDSNKIRHKLNTKNTVETIFAQAQGVFNKWEKLPIEKRTADKILRMLDFDFFKVLDSVTIARSRKHIEKYYDISEIGNFPKRLPPVTKTPGLAINKNITDITYDGIVTRLDMLGLCVYTPFSYIQKSQQQKYADLYDTQVSTGRAGLSQKVREDGLKYLMNTLILKRLESSVHSFRVTLQNILKLYQQNITAITNHINNKPSDVYSDIIDQDAILDEGEDSFTTTGKNKIDIADMDYLRWQNDLMADMAIIREILDNIAPITPDQDDKLQDLIRTICKKIENPINNSNHKILVFSAFSDTAEYIYKNIADYIQNTYTLNTALFTGKRTTHNISGKYDFDTLLTLFSPQSKSKDKILPDDTNTIDIVVATDCISEGQNLQDCDYLINYDIHWNPVRIIQRFGRIDRIGSQNTDIQMVNYWPDISLDKYINLKERVENRMVIADATATGHDNVLSPKQQNDIEYRKKQLERMQSEVIDLEDVKTGISITDLGLNDFRMDLLNYLEQNPALKNSAKGMHAVIPANQQQGLEPGVIYVMKNVHAEVNSDTENRLHPFYLVYITDDSCVLLDHAHAKDILDILRNHCRTYDKPHKSAYTLFNSETDDGKHMGAYSNLLTTAIKSIIQVNEDSAIDSLFAGGETTALNKNIKGLRDFELIAFIVVQRMEI